MRLFLTVFIITCLLAPLLTLLKIELSKESQWSETYSATFHIICIALTYYLISMPLAKILVAIK
jgi:hypothetical protein